MGGKTSKRKLFTNRNRIEKRYDKGLCETCPVELSENDFRTKCETCREIHRKKQIYYRYFNELFK